MLHKDEIKILRIAQLAPVLVIIFSLFSIYIVYENNASQFSQEVKLLKKEATQEMESLIQSEVERVYDFIVAEKQLTSEKIAANLKERVQEAHAIALSLYKNNQHLNNDELKKLITDTLREIRFNKGRGYFFIYEKNGVSVMHPILPQLESRNLWDFQDVKGRFVIRELSEVSDNEQGGVLTWWWNKPSDKQAEYEKIGYSKSFAPFNWFIGTGDYIVDYEEELKRDLLAIVNKVRFGKEGYIFVIDKTGTYLSNAKESYIGQSRNGYQDRNDFSITKEVLEVAKVGEGFLSYMGGVQPTTGKASAKRSFVKGFADWQWAIGSGTYLQDIDELLARKKAQLNERNSKELIQSITVSSIVFVLLFIVSLFFSTSIKRRFQIYQEKVKQKNLDLHDLNVNLERLVLTRTVALEELNKELEVTLDDLKSTQSKLLESEKMASMVGLVSGIAHELNTPLGIMVTAISQVENEIESFFEKLKKQQITRKDLLHVEETWSLGYKLLDTNLQRSVQLVHNFKSLSTQQYIDNVDVFFLKMLLSSLRSIFERRFKSLGIDFIVEIEEGHTLTSYQGVLVDVLTQLIINSLTHAFENIGNPRITISVSESNGIVEINYCDNGVGSENIDKIFEPFYTTKRGSDCTGLGLAIIYNQVVHKLNGTIECSLLQVQGLAFNIKIPKVIHPN